MPNKKPAETKKPKPPYEFKSLQGWPEKEEKALEKQRPSRASE
jgi:hypothetical protein